MKNILVLVHLFISLFTLSGQNTISGIVIDKNEKPLVGASVYIQDSYDGSTTLEDGSFSFTTDSKGEVVLEITYLGYEDRLISKNIKELDYVTITLRSSIQAMNSVTISASTFTAGDASKMSALNSLDIVTTAGSNGDVIAALQTLPGTQQNSDDGRLLVRGGDAYETSIYIDGLKVFSPYTRTIGGTPSRGRYSPFLFKGVSFNTGAYSAEYGNALSGILNMKTIDEPSETKTDISIMSVGAGIGHTQKLDNESVSINLTYLNLSPYNAIVENRKKWNKPFSGLSGEMIYRRKGKKSLFKSYLAGDTGGFELEDDNIQYLSPQTINVVNNNLYTNHTYRHYIDDKTSLNAGVSAGYNNDKFNLSDSLQSISELLGAHARLYLARELSDRLILRGGLGFLSEKNKITNSYLVRNSELTQSLDERIWSGYIESDYYFSNNTAIQLGLRVQYPQLQEQIQILPRISLSQMIGKNGQVTAAYGKYNQNVRPEYRYSNEFLDYEQAEHFVLSYNYKTKGTTIRAEAYLKSYDNLIEYDGNDLNYSRLSNQGYGNAYGIDLFWRSKDLIDFLEFWISYGWLQNKRKYKDFPVSATPSFSTEHNLSVVTKRWIEKLNSQLGVSYTFSTGRPYNNPNSSVFMNELSKPFHNINLSWAYLISQQQIIFASVSNPLDFENEFGRRYAKQRNTNDIFPSEAIRPNADQFFFIGYFLTISKNKETNQLDNL